MARILFVSPIPPAETGIASYTESVLAELRDDGFDREHEVEVMWPVPDNADAIAESFDLAVYHIGNNVEFHGRIYELALRVPGLVVLHDLSLDGLVQTLIDTGHRLGLPSRNEAEATVRALAPMGTGEEGPLQVPWCALLVRRSRGVLVHAAFGKRYLEKIGSRTPVFVAPHPPISDLAPEAAGPRELRAVRGRLRKLGDPLLVGTLGNIDRAKGIDAVVEALARLDRRVHLAIVGRTVPWYSVDEVVRARGMGGRVTVAANVPDREFDAWLHASDVVVNLRHPHRGEVSGTLVRALQLGKPTVVSATGTYLDLPEDVVARVSAGRPSAQEVAGTLERLVRDAELREEIGGRASDFVERQRRDRATARAYRHAIDATLSLLRDPARAALARWARAMTDMGADVDTVRRGLGTRYADALEALTAP